MIGIISLLLINNIYLKNVVLIILFLFVQTLAAQENYNIVHYDETTLPQTSIGSIQQDANGYLWMSSQFGIVRFDGTHIKAFTTKNLEALRSNRIRVCAKTFDDKFYFVDEYHTVLKLTSSSNMVALPRLAFDTGFPITLYSRDNNNDIIFFQPHKGVSFTGFLDSLKWDFKKELIRLYLLEKDKGYFFYYDHINKVRVCFFERGNFQSGRVRDNFSVQGTFKLGNQLFYQHKSTEAYLYQNINYAEKVKIQGLPPLLDQIFRQKKYTFISTSSGTFLYADGRLFEYTRSNSGITATLLFERLPCKGVTGICKEKRTGNIIISTLSEGFYVIKRKDFAVINLATNVNRKDGGKYLNNNIVYAIEKLDGQRIFTYGYFLQEDGSEAALASQKFDPDRFNPYFLYKRDRDHIWLQFNEWVEELNTKTLQVKRMLHVIDAKKVIKLTDTSQILLSSKKIILLKDSSHEILYENDTSSFLSLERINNDTLAIGGHKGLFYYSLAKKSFQRVSGTETFTVRFLFKDRNSRLWFTTYGQGLFSVSGATVKQISSDKEGYLNTGHCILQDKQNDFWVSTNEGLFKIEYNSLWANLTNTSTKLRYVYFDKYDGFKTNEFNGGCYPSGLYDSINGLMYFPSMNGIVKFNPHLIQNPESSKQIVIDDVLINDSVHLKLENSNFFKMDNKTASIRIDFSSPHFGNANNLKFYYSLDDQAEYWKEAGDQQSINLNNLPGGTHTLRIKKEEGISEPVIHVISFEIEKKFGETTFFKLLVVASVFFVVYLLFQARIQRLTNERTRLEKEVSERTKDQAQLIKQLKHSISDLTQLQQELSQLISHKENVIAILIHDIKSPLNFLTSVANHLETDFETNSFEKNKEIIKEVTKSLNSLNLFTKDFTIWLNASNPGHIQKSERLDLHKIIDQALNIYKEIIAINNISVMHSSMNAIIYSDGPMVKAVVRNLIDNAVKNTENGAIAIDVALAKETNTCRISIRDEGKGLDEELLHELNAYFQSQQEGLSFSSSQFGHKVIKDFLAKLGGTIHYTMNAHAGLTAIVNLPVGSDAKA